MSFKELFTALLCQRNKDADLKVSKRSTIYGNFELLDVAIFIMSPRR